MTHGEIHIGLYVIFAIVMLPVYFMVLGWFVGKPRYYRAVWLTFGYGVFFAIAIVIGIVILDLLLSVVTQY